MPAPLELFQRHRLLISVIGASLAAALVVGLWLWSGHDGDDPGADPTVTVSGSPGPPPEETQPDYDLPVTTTTVVDSESDFLDGVLADGTVTDDELTDAYERFIDCLADGGGVGEYSFDVELRSSIIVDWRLPGDDANGNGAAALRADCSRRFLGRLTQQWVDANPAPDDLSDRRYRSIVECVRPIDADAARRLPTEITSDEGDSGLYIDSDVNLSGITESATALLEIERCVDSIGRPWEEFGGGLPDDSVAATTTEP